MRLLKRDRDHGGLSCIVLGGTGAGKTTFMLSAVALPLLETREILFWRDSEFCQWTFLPLNRVKLLLSPFYEYEWIDKDTGETVNVDDYVRNSYCYTLEDYYEKAEPNVLNVVYTDYAGWFNFISSVLLMRRDVRWVSLYMDEVEKFVPANVEGNRWRMNLAFANALAEFRKNFISFYCAAQDYGDVDYRVTNKLNFKVYLRNARVPKAHSMVYPQVPRHLNMGEAVIEGMGEFTKHTFTKLQHQLNLLVRIKPLLAGNGLAESYAADAAMEELENEAGEASVNAGAS